MSSLQGHMRAHEHSCAAWQAQASGDVVRPSHIQLVSQRLRRYRDAQAHLVQLGGRACCSRLHATCMHTRMHAHTCVWAMHACVMLAPTCHEVPPAVLGRRRPPGRAVGAPLGMPRVATACASATPTLLAPPLELQRGRSAESPFRLSVTPTLSVPA
eukprot:352068-Chlamydomonas_euryale.AAC.13